MRDLRIVIVCEVIDHELPRLSAFERIAATQLLQSDFGLYLCQIIMLYTFDVGKERERAALGSLHDFYNHTGTNCFASFPECEA